MLNIVPERLTSRDRLSRLKVNLAASVLAQVWIVSVGLGAPNSDGDNVERA